MPFRQSVSIRNGCLSAFNTALADGYIRIYDGSQPATPEAAITTQVLLAELRFGNPAFGAPSGGSMTANAITADSSANATGTAAWARLLGSDGTTVVCDCTVTATGGGGDIQMNSISIQSSAQVSITSATLTEPME